jgi:glycosyltransferase involved in cell wall biosynthesis
MDSINTPQDKPKIVIISNAAIGHQMSGPAIRCFEFANILGKFFKVSLVTPVNSSLSSERFQILTCERHDEDTMQKIVENHDIILIQGQILEFFPFLKDTEKILMVDLYCPFVLEELEKQKRLGNNRPASTERMEEWEKVHQVILKTVQDQLQAGDYFLCANERQWDFWLGMLCALNRINPYIYDQDSSIRCLLDIVPFGIPSEKPAHRKKVLRGIYKGITEEDKILIWGGSILNWLDTLTLIRAMDRVSQVRKDVKLFFMGTEHPDQIREKMLADTLNLSKKLGLTDRVVFFHSWVPYHERQNYFLEADIGISAHFTHLETRLSFRTRMLDYIWTGLPIIATKGDYFGELIQSKQLGLTVEPEDIEGLATAILKLVDDETFRRHCSENVQALAPQFTWEAVTQPLITFCQNPRKAVDRQRWNQGQNASMSSLRLVGAGSKPASITSTSYLDHLYHRILEQIQIQKLEKKALQDRIERLENTPSLLTRKRETNSYLTWVVESNTRIIGLAKNIWAARRRKNLHLTQYPSCEIQGRDRVGQSFVAERPDLYRIDIKFATYMRQVCHDIVFYISEIPKGVKNTRQEDLACIKVNASQLKDNAFYSFIFPQQMLSEGKSYYFYLESPNSAKGDAVSVWCVKDPLPQQFHCLPTQYYERGWKTEGHILFKAYYG